MITALEFKHHHGPFRGDEHVAGWPVHGPQLHVPTASGVAHVMRIDKQAAGEVPGNQLRAKPVEAIAVDAFCGSGVSH